MEFGVFTWLQIFVALPITIVVAIVLWKIADSISGRGASFRPVSDMDEVMTKIEHHFTTDKHKIENDVDREIITDQKEIN